MSVVRVGDAFSARVQRVALTASPKLFPLCARTLLNVHRRVHRKVGGTVQATMLYDRNTAGNTLPSGHVQRAASFHPYFYGQLLCSILRLDSDHAHTLLVTTTFRLRTLPLAAATAYSPSARDTRFCCRAHHSLYRWAANRQAPEGRHERWAHCALVMEGNDAG